MNLALEVLLGLIAWTLLALVVAVMIGAMTTGPDALPRSAHASSRRAPSRNGPAAA
jgi:membrane protein required for beta-lactamase induction